MTTSIHGKEMMENSPRYYEGSRIFQSHINTKGIELDNLSDILADIKAQLSISTATWGLQYWEYQLGIPITTLPPEMRRAYILLALVKRKGIRRVDLQEALERIGFPNSKIIELFRDTIPLPLHNASWLYSNAWRTGQQWAMFKVLLGLSDWRNFREADKREIEEVIEANKPAHMAYIGADLAIPFIDRISVTDGLALPTLSFDIEFVDLFLRPGLRHAAQMNYSKALNRDASVSYNSSIFHVCFVTIEGPTIPHRLTGEEIFEFELVGGPH